MKRVFLAAGVAALAIAAPAMAERGGKGDDRAKAAKVERGGDRNRADRRVERRAKARVQLAERRENRAEQLAERREKRAERFIERREKARDQLLDRREKARERVIEARLRDRDGRRVRDDDEWRVPGRGHPIVEGCPPGLFSKGCIPPGQAKELVGRRLDRALAARALPRELRNLYRDDDDYYYRYANGYLYRVDRDKDVITSLLPLFGAGLGLGQMFPTSYANAFVPSYYRPFYRDSDDDYYRFANGYVYEIDRDSGLVEDIIPLMANGYGVGQMLPAGYSAYNVPYQYRDRYYDTDDYSYRYAPGAIYRVDPKTQLITSIASLLSPNGFSVGQQLPAGYGAYNVPLGYRDQYSDTQDAWYRYNNGYIYQVDPTTQLITAIIRAIV